MKPSSGNPALSPTAESKPCEFRLPAPALRPEPCPDYRKPALKRLGLLRSVTGSDLKW